MVKKSARRTRRTHTPAFKARIFLGVHFPLDMVGAVAVVCLAWAAIHLVWGSVGNAIVSRIEQIYRLVLARPISHGWIGR